MSAHRILVINPNTTVAMTDALRPLINGLKYESTSFTFYTAPSGVPSINNEDDAAVSLDGALQSVGTATTGLDADQLHKAPREELETRMRDATKSLLAAGARAICLGCAGMAGMDEIVRRACVEELGEMEGTKIVIVDGVVAGAIWLEGMLRATRQ
ncbi:hypothetical protein B0A48_08041 [Cryoendolithus antarcticus]|uniref:Asp/Glu/hydantoin racemase n=1 Tax=Cryoendolithus antarcticus TaxID=1507870 RepID=A0A1V8T179_9PEZI|nr:hypothetical protein B0A48_08041 [Cryoendolithus antarcticus]